MVRELHRKYGSHKLVDWQPSCRRLAIEFEPDTFWLKPEEAIKALERRSILIAGDVNGSITQSVKAVILEQLNSLPYKDAEMKISEIIGKNYRRAQLITTTETTYAYNRGRLAAFQANEVDYVRFSAVIDSRTSSQCRSRHGKILSMESTEQNIALQKAHKKVLKIAQKQNNSNEVALMYNQYNNEQISILGTVNSVDIDSNINIKVLQNKSYDKELVMIHNHPSTSNFSFADLDYFINNDYIGVMSLVTNQGEVYTLIKISVYDYDKIKSIERDLVKKYSIDNQDTIASRFLKICKDGGIIYVKGK